MADNYLSGLSGAVSVNDVTMSFGKWKAPIKTKAVSVNNFTSGGFNQNVEGFSGCELTCEGPYNAGNMPLTSGAMAAFVLQLASGNNVSVNARITNLEIDNDAEGNPRVNVTAESNGPFSLSIS